MPPMNSGSSSSIPEPEYNDKGISLYWDTDPSQWDMTLFDQHYVEHHPSATKQAAHQELRNQIEEMKKACDGNDLVITELTRVEKSLRRSKKDHGNAKFWKDLKPEVARDSATETAYAYKEKVSITRIIALKIEQRAKELELAASRKRPSEDSENGTVSSATSSGEYRHRRQRSRISKTTRKTHINRGIKLTDYDAKWIIDGECISTELMSVRDKSIRMYCEDRSLPDFRELAIKDIFLLCRSMDRSISRCLGHDKHEAIFASLPRAPVINLPPEATVWANDLLHMVSSNPLLPLKQIKKKTAQWIVDACQNDDDDSDLAIFADILHRSIPRLIKSQLEEDLEDSFVHDVLTDLLDVVFGEEKILRHHWANKKLPSTSTEVNMKPDFMASSKPAQRSVYLFAVEVKPPANISDPDVCEDRVKLGEEMKTMMQLLETLNIENPETCGLLVQGYNCTLFKMDIVYKPLYRMMEMCSFTLPGDWQNLLLLPHAVECILSCQLIVKRNAERVGERYVAKSTKNK